MKKFYPKYVKYVFMFTIYIHDKFSISSYNHSLVIMFMKQLTVNYKR
jgi:hypothetical protein